MCRMEAPLNKAFALAQTGVHWTSWVDRWRQETAREDDPSCWKDSAKGREVFRDFCRWFVFERRV